MLKITRKLIQSKLAIIAASLLLVIAGTSQTPAKSDAPVRRTYFGFDKNDYPGDDLMATLHKTFSFTSYWLNNPPGMTYNAWVGKRVVLRSQGFGFVLVFNGRLYSEIKGAASKGQDQASLGRSDAEAAINAAGKEGFPARAIIFLDQEEGGRLLPAQSAYLFAWIEAVSRSRFRAGVYCSGIAVGSDNATTAADILAHYSVPGKGRPDHVLPSLPRLWVANDQCPPAPGCVVGRHAPPPAAGGIPRAAIWQYAQSPRRAQFTAACASSYSADNACYAPGLTPAPNKAIDLDTSNSPDPSDGR